MTFCFRYRSTDAGAPSFSSAVGSGVSFLDAILVNGYNSKTVTISQTAGLATASCTAHGFVTGQVLRHSGAGEAGYNIDAVITVTGANAYTFAVAGGTASPATGTITAKVCPLDFTIDYTGTNLRSYRAATGNRFYLAVDDTNANDMRVRGFESMTAAGPANANGSAPFPTDAQFSGGLYWCKNYDAATTSAPWYVFSNGTFIVLVSRAYQTGYNQLCLFGDIFSYVAGDSYATMLSGSAAAVDYAGAGSQFSTIYSVGPSSYLARTNGGAGASVAAKKQAPYQAINNTANYSGYDSNLPTYPATCLGGLLLTQAWLTEASASKDPRGRIPGVWVPWHKQPLTVLDTFSGAAGTDLAGRTFVALDGSNGAGQYIIETSPWT